MEPIVLVHGGAGAISDDAKAQKLVEGVKKAAKIGHEILAQGGSCLDAVEAAVISMENDENFNAGLGSVLNNDGDVEMDASVMVGSDLSAGAVTVVKDVKNPISLARLVMEKTEHVLLAAEGATRLAQEHGVALLPPNSLVSEARREAFLKEKPSLGCPAELGTVGALAMDGDGKLAAATSTGGRHGKLPGRCSDTCMLGSGTYADDEIGAVSTTGHGETIAKFCLAHAIIKAMEHGEGAQEATQNCIQKMTEKLKNTAGAITLSNKGDVGVAFSTKRMSWAYQKGGTLCFGVDHNEKQTEKL